MTIVNLNDHRYSLYKPTIQCFNNINEINRINSIPPKIYKLTDEIKEDLRLDLKYIIQTLYNMVMPIPPPLPPSPLIYKHLITWKKKCTCIHINLLYLIYNINKVSIDTINMLYTLLIFLYLIRISKYILFLHDTYNINMNSISLKKYLLHLEIIIKNIAYLLIIKNL